MLPLKDFQPIGPITYTACRYFMSTVFTFTFKVLTYWSGIRDDDEHIVGTFGEVKQGVFAAWKDLVFWASLGGVFSVGGAILQQMGLVTVSAGKAAFITGMFVVFVPIFEYFIPGFGHQLTPSSWAMALVSMFGLFLLTGCAEAEVCFGGAIRWGEVMVFISMLFWSASILSTDVASKRVDGVMLTLMEFVFTTIVVAIVAAFVEPQFLTYPFLSIRRNGLNICVLGFTEAMGFTLSTLGQRYTDSSRAALLYSLEGTFCSLLGYIFLHETLTYVELLGCALMLSSAVLSSSVFSSSAETSDNVDGIALLETNSITNQHDEYNYQNNNRITNINTQQNGRESRINPSNDSVFVRSFSNLFQKVNSSLKGSSFLAEKAEESSIPIINRPIPNFGSTNSER
mmetsp:Transcript_32538/g.46948  ORF Transcript_32538/g.46948 Transcript_32538/m.46948 type:complete len:399 (-) Transcript_32538:335-1531(-)